jgi:hypothetical protein
MQSKSTGTPPTAWKYTKVLQPVPAGQSLSDYKDSPQLWRLFGVLQNRMILIWRIFC